MKHSTELAVRYLRLASSPMSEGNFAGADVRYTDQYELLEKELGKASALHGGGRAPLKTCLLTVESPCP